MLTECPNCGMLPHFAETRSTFRKLAYLLIARKCLRCIDCGQRVTVPIWYRGKRHVHFHR